MKPSSLVRLGAVADFHNGVAFKQSDWVESGSHRIIRIQNLTDPGKPYNRTDRDVPEKNIAAPGDILVSWSGTLGVFEWHGSDRAYVNQHIFKVSPDTRVVDSRYLKAILEKALLDMGRHAHGAVMKHVNRKEFEGTLIPLPPLEEQKRIAAILDKADELRTKRKEAIAELNKLQQSVFLDMFGDPVTNPKGWKRIRLDEVLQDIQGGWSPKCVNTTASESEWGVIKLGAVSSGSYDSTENKLLPDGVDPRDELEIKAGDLLFVRKNTYELVGASAYVFETRGKLLIPDLVFRLRAQENEQAIDTIFLWQQLSHPAVRSKLRSLAGGAAGSMPNISKTRLRDLQILLPPADLQGQFRDAIERIRKIGDLGADSLNCLDALFDALQSKAFRGEL